MKDKNNSTRIRAILCFGVTTMKTPNDEGNPSLSDFNIIYHPTDIFFGTERNKGIV